MDELRGEKEVLKSELDGLKREVEIVKSKKELWTAVRTVIYTLGMGSGLIGIVFFLVLYFSRG